jgi:hypothetical protein
MLITRATHPSALWPGIQAWFGMSYDRFPKEYTQIFDVRTSDKAYEEIGSLVGFGLAQTKAEGASIAYDVDNEGPRSRFTHVTYALGYIVSREAIEDNQYQQIATARTAALSRSMWVTKEIVHANVLNRMQDTSLPSSIGGDGQPLVSNAHPTDAGAKSNLLTPADLSEAALEDAAKQIWAATDSRGLPIQLGIKRLIISPADAFNATRLLKSELRTGGNNNDINALRSMGIIPEVVINHYLTDNDAWFLQTDVDEGLISYQRRALEFAKDEDFETENAKAKASERYSAGFADWKAIFGNPGA